MIFEGKSISEITDEEIDSLVRDHISERKHLEFKATINYRDDDQKLELLRDIVSFANGGGGYFIVGIRDDGNGRAQSYASGLITDVERIKKAIVELSHAHISEPIEGLEVVTRTVNNNPLVIVRIPASARAPHMVTFNYRTDFYTRYVDGKKVMRLSEIKEAFKNDSLERRLSDIGFALNKIMKVIESEKECEIILEKMQSGVIPTLLFIENGDSLARVTVDRFEKEIRDIPYFSMAATPVNPRAGLINVDSDEILKFIQEPPGSREAGWNMHPGFAVVERFSEGIRWGEKDYRYLELLGNGHMEFWTPLNENFCWRQSEEEFRRRPRLYPYPVTEYPATFLRLYRAITTESKIDGEFLITLYYRNIRGYILLPYSPRSIGFRFPRSDVKPFSEPHFSFQTKVSSNFTPDKTAYDLVKRVYAAFGLEQEAVPFFNKEKEEFDFS
ncbi:MAG: ATP-binding protein [Firmicutes bacterium]|nr:ATP-binding protein [Bacillota bacterium]MCL5039644.1 ATP-binding protein [Bacillota bacterium]